MPKPTHSQDSSQVTPKPELEKRTRRKFSTQYKLRIIAEADACKHGELGALLREKAFTVISCGIGALSCASRALKDPGKPPPAQKPLRLQSNAGFSSLKKKIAS